MIEDGGGLVVRGGDFFGIEDREVVVVDLGFCICSINGLSSSDSDSDDEGTVLLCLARRT